MFVLTANPEPDLPQVHKINDLIQASHPFVAQRVRVSHGFLKFSGVLVLHTEPTKIVGDVTERATESGGLV